MIIWTIQDPAVWDQLEKTGIYTTPDARIEFPPEEDDALCHFNYAYRWLSERMAERIGPPPEGVRYPVWAWYKQQGRADGKPDMRSSQYLKGSPCVRMKLDIPDYEVLVSDFDNWYFALSYCYLSRSERDDEDFERWYESLGIGFHDIGNWVLDSPDLRLVRSHVEQSWERMLGIEPQPDTYWHFPWEKRSLQATFWTLRREHVLSVERFISR